MSPELFCLWRQRHTDTTKCYACKSDFVLLFFCLLLCDIIVSSANTKSGKKSKTNGFFAVECLENLSIVLIASIKAFVRRIYRLILNVFSVHMKAFKLQVCLYRNLNEFKPRIFNPFQM